jgi:hypothetical protein
MLFVLICVMCRASFGQVLSPEGDESRDDVAVTDAAVWEKINSALTEEQLVEVTLRRDGATMDACFF